MRCKASGVALIFAFSLLAVSASAGSLESRIDSVFDGAEDTFQCERARFRARARNRLVAFVADQRACGDEMARALVELGEGDLREFDRYFEEEFACWTNYPYAPGVRPEVLDLTAFGAKGDGVADDAPAFERAFAAVRALNGKPSVLRIPPGTYSVRTEAPAAVCRKFNLDASALTNCVVEGVSPERTEIVFGLYEASGISFANAKNTTLRNVRLRYAETPFTQGRVLEFDRTNRWAVIRHEPGTLKPTDPRFRRGSQRTQCCGQFDAEGRELYGYANIFFDLNAEDLGEGRYRVHFADHPAYAHANVPVGSWLVLPDRNNSYQSVRATGARLCNFENVWIVNSRAGAFTVSGGWMITGWKCKVRPAATNLVLSTNADSFFNSRGTHLAHCEFHHMNDDGANSLGNGQMIHSVTNGGRTIVHRPCVERRNPGDKVVLIRPSDGRFLAVMEIASAGGVRGADGAVYQATTFTKPVPDGIRSLDSIGMKELTAAERQEMTRGFSKIGGGQPDQIYFPMAFGVGFIAFDNDIHDNRNLGIQIQCPNAIIESNRIARVTGCIQMSCLTDWMEGPSPYNVLIRGNRFSQFACGIRTHFNTAPGGMCRSTPFRGLEIVDNEFLEPRNRDRMVVLKHTRGAIVRGNSPLGANPDLTVMPETFTEKASRARWANPLPALDAKGIWLTAEGREDSADSFGRILRSVRGPEPCAIHLADGEYHFYSSSATNMRFHVSNHDQPEIRPVFLPFIGVTNVSVVAKNAKFVMHGMGTAILVQDSLGVSFKGITVEWEKPFFAKAEIVGFEDGKTRVRFPTRDKVVVEDGKLMLCGEDWKVNLRDGNVFRRETHEMVERTADVIFSGKGAACENGDFLIDVDLSKIGAGAKVGDVYVMRNGYRPHPIVCLDRAKDTVFEDFVFRDGFGMGILAQLSENVTLRGGGCYPRDRDEYNSNTIDATHFSNCRGTMTVENCRFEGMMDDALNVHSTCLGIVAKPAADTIRCRYMHHQAVGFGVFSAGDAVRFIAGRTLENGFVGKVKSVVTHDEREITLVLEKPIPPEYGVGDAVENADWQCAVVFRNNTVANNRARGVLFTTPKRIVCEGNFFDHVSGSAVLFAGDAQGWYESGACEDVVIRKNRFRDCLTSVFQYCDALISMHPEVKDLRAQKRRYHRNVLIEDNEIETFDVPLLYALSAENVTWRNNSVKRHDRYRSWGKKPFEVIGSEDVVIDEVPYAVTWNGRALELNPARISSVPFCRVWPGHQRELSQTEMSHFVRFDRTAGGDLSVRGANVGRRLKRLLPLSAEGSLVAENDDLIRLRISSPGAYVIEFDGLPALHVFADPPLPPVPAPGDGGRMIRFARGEHFPGVVVPKNGDVVVLDEGAVVYGSLFVLNATNVTVTGRGIFDGSRLERSDDALRKFRREHGLSEIDTESACFAYSVYGSENVTISGVTFRDPPFWTLVIRNQCRHTLIDNIHIVGNWRYNSDGVDVCASQDTVIRNSFFRTFDDCVIARGPYMKGEHAPVDGMVVTNCSLYCDWGVPFKAQVQDFHGSTIENVTMRDCRILAMRENALFLAVRYGCDLDVLRNLTFEDLEFDFFPQPQSRFQSHDGEAFVHVPLKENCLALAFSYTLGKNLDNQVNAPMEDPEYYRFVFEDFTFRRFRALGERRRFNVRLSSLVPRHEIRNVDIVDLPEHDLITTGDVRLKSDIRQRMSAKGEES